MADLPPPPAEWLNGGNNASSNSGQPRPGSVYDDMLYSLDHFLDELGDFDENNEWPEASPAVQVSEEAAEHDERENNDYNDEDHEEFTFDGRDTGDTLPSVPSPSSLPPPPTAAAQARTSAADSRQSSAVSRSSRPNFSAASSDHDSSGGRFAKAPSSGLSAQDAFLRVKSVEGRSPATEAGLLPDDLVVKVGASLTRSNAGEPSEWTRKVRDICVAAHHAGAAVPFFVFRGKSRFEEVALILVPRLWDGQGLTGAKFELHFSDTFVPTPQRRRKPTPNALGPPSSNDFLSALRAPLPPAPYAVVKTPPPARKVVRKYSQTGANGAPGGRAEAKAVQRAKPAWTRPAVDTVSRSSSGSMTTSADSSDDASKQSRRAATQRNRVLFRPGLKLPEHWENKNGSHAATRPVAAVRAPDSPAPVLKKDYSPEEFKEYQIAHYAWQQRHPDAPVQAKGRPVKLALESPEHRVVAVTTEDSHETVADLRRRVCAQFGVSDADPDWRLYIGGLAMEGPRRLRDYKLEAAGEHLWFRHSPPGNITEEVLSAWEPKKPLPKQVHESVANVFHSARLKRETLTNKKNRKFLYTLLQSVRKGTQEHTPSILEVFVPPEPKKLVSLSKLRDYKHRDPSLHAWELETYLSEEEFAEALHCKRSEWFGVPFGEKWARKRAAKIAF